MKIKSVVVGVMLLSTILALGYNGIGIKDEKRLEKAVEKIPILTLEEILQGKLPISFKDALKEAISHNTKILKDVNKSESKIIALKIAKMGWVDKKHLGWYFIFIMKDPSGGEWENPIMVLGKNNCVPFLEDNKEKSNKKESSMFIFASFRDCNINVQDEKRLALEFEKIPILTSEEILQGKLPISFKDALNEAISHNEKILKRLNKKDLKITNLKMAKVGWVDKKHFGWCFIFSVKDPSGSEWENHIMVLGKNSCVPFLDEIDPKKEQMKTSKTASSNLFRSIWFPIKK